MADQNEVVLGLNLDISGVQKSLYDMIGSFTGTGKEFDRITSNIEKSFKNLEAIIKRFGVGSDEAQAATKRYQTSLTALIANGVDPAASHFKALENAVSSSNNALNESAANIKKSNQTWTNLALVVQDLPFGFRGIQNNLPALFGSIATGTGIAYFAFSALVAIVTAYGDKIRDVFLVTTEAEKSQVAYNEILKESNKTYAQAFTDVINLKQAVEDEKNGFITKDEVVKKYNETMGKTLGTQKDFKTVVDSILGQGDAYVDYMGKLTAANVAASKLGEAIVAMLDNSQKKANEFVDNWDIFWSTKFNMGGLVNSMVASGQELTKAGEKNKQTAIQQEGEKAVRIQDIWKNLVQQVNDARKKLTFTPEQDKFKQNNFLLEKLKAEEQLYKDDLFMKRAIGLEVLKEEERLAVEKATHEKASAIQIGDIVETFAIKRRIIEKETADGITKFRLEALKEREKNEKEEADKAEKTAKEINARNLQNSLDFLKIQSDTEEKILNKKNKGDTQARVKILEDYKSKLYDLASIGGWTASELDKIDDAIIRVDAAIEGSKDKLKDFKISWTDTANSINQVIVSLIRDSVSKLAENIGKALAGDKVDLFGGFASMVADAAISIGKALIAYGIAIQAFHLALANPVLAVVAGAGLVIAGSFLKSKLDQQNKSTKKFANGGIISGPTYGLMGEYPGAKSNPEVVAPLDKLKGMMGGGTLETRISGSDLWVVLNRTQKNRNTTF